MTECTFCGKKISPGCGKVLVKNDGKLINLCSTKCEKNLFKLKRKPREQAWTEEFRKVKETKISGNTGKASKGKK